MTSTFTHDRSNGTALHIVCCMLGQICYGVNTRYSSLVYAYV